MKRKRQFIQILSPILSLIAVVCPDAHAFDLGNAIQQFFQQNQNQAQNQPVLSHEIISDSLVKNLDCSRLTRDTVLSSLQEDAFSIAKQLPIKNWSSGELSQCWSLAHAQRLTFYLGRFGIQGASASPEEVQSVLAMYRGSSDLQIFPLHESSLQTRADGDFVSELVKGFQDSSGETHSFQTDIESYQQWRFYDPLNLSFITGGDRDRTVPENVQTFQSIQGDLAKNRLPMLILRADTDHQHVVLVKTVSPVGDDGYHKMMVYDSNFPGYENVLWYNEYNNEFYAPSILQPLGNEPMAPVGVFLVDDDDMDSIQTALYQHYLGRCQQPQP